MSDNLVGVSLQTKYTTKERTSVNWFKSQGQNVDSPC